MAAEQVNEYLTLRATQLDEQIAALMLEARRLADVKKKYNHAETMPVKRTRKAPAKTD